MADHENLMKSLLGKLYQVLTGGDDTVQKTPDNFISWCTPGIPIAAEDLQFAAKWAADSAGEDKRTLLAQASDFARLVNLVPDPSGVYDRAQQASALKTDDRLIWQVYGNVLQFSEVASGELTAEQKQKIEKFQNLLRVKKTVRDLYTDEETEEAVDGPVLKAYNTKMTEYLAAATEYNNKRIAAMNSDNPVVVQDWALNAANYRRRVKAAMDAWVSGGYKNEVDQMNAFIDQTTRRDLTLLKARLQDQFDAGKLTDLNDQEFLFTSFTPANFATREGWTSFSFREANEKSYERSETNAWGAELAGSKGLFKARFATTGEISSTEQKVDTSKFTMSFELAQVPISRPWFAPELVVNSAWRFAAGKGMSPLSDGGRPPKGQLVAYPTAAVFIRNVELEFAELHQAGSTYSQKIHVEADVSYGPFTFSGKYDRSVGERKFQSSLSEGKLKVPGLQIIAFKCRILPKAPNPSSEIKSWS